MAKGPKKLYAVVLCMTYEVEVEARSDEEAKLLGVDRLKKTLGAENVEALEIEHADAAELEDVTEEYDDLDSESQEQSDADDDSTEDLHEESGVRTLTAVVEDNKAESDAVADLARAAGFKVTTLN